MDIRVSPILALALALSLAAMTMLAACGRRSEAGADQAHGSTASSAQKTAAAPILKITGPAPEYAATPATSADNVLTYHINQARTGLQPNESILTPANVKPASFGKLFSDQVDGFLNAQPLYVAGVRIPGKGRHNVVYVATENDTVYAFDADRPGPPLWKASLLDGGSPISSAEVSCGQIVPRIGITGTPVIDLKSGTLYAVAAVRHGTASSGTYAQMLHAIDITTGKEKFGGPVAIAGSVAGTGAGSVKGKLSFDAFNHVNRAGLALANGVVYIGFASHCDVYDYHGWLFGYDAKRLNLRTVFNATPNGTQGAIWQTGSPPAVDAAGHIYVITGNGTFDAASGGSDYGDSILKLALRGNRLRPIDFFTPFNEKVLEKRDLDIGSGGAVLIPDQPGPHRHLIVGAGKNAILYVVDRDYMRKFNPKGNGQIVQEISGEFSGNFSTPAFWNGHLYLGTVNQPLRVYLLKNGRFSASPVSETSHHFNYPGTTPAVSSNGNKDAIVWGLETNGYDTGAPAVLFAYDATNLTHQLYSSSGDGSRDVAHPAIKFSTPIIAHGRVYFGTQNHLDVYGLFR